MRLKTLIILLLSIICVYSEISVPEQICGQVKVGIQTIVGGNDVERGAYPW